MSSPILPNSFSYNDLPFGGVLMPTIIAPIDPSSTSQNGYPPGYLWLSDISQGGSGNLFYQSGFASGVPTWVQVAGASGVLNTINSIAPVSNNINILGTANQITVTNGVGQLTLSLPSALVAPGSVTATTTLTATLGAITASNGNFVASTSGTGILLNSPSATGVAASPVIVNGRSGRATFTTVSIAAAADLTLTLTNSSITAASTIVMLSMSGATTGSALSIKSKTASAGSLAIVVTNGTGATTTTADIQIDFVVVNA